MSKNQLKSTSDCIWYNLPEIKKHLPNHVITIMNGSKEIRTVRTKENGFAHFRFSEIDTESEEYGARIPRTVTHNLWAYCYVVSTVSYELINETTKRTTFNLRREVFEAAFTGDRTDHYFFVAGGDRTWFFSAEEMLTEIKKFNETTPEHLQTHQKYESLVEGKEFIRLPLFLMDNYSKKRMPLEEIIDLDNDEYLRKNPCFPLKSYIYNIQPVVYISHEEHMKRLHAGVAKANTKKAIIKKDNTRHDFETMSKEDFIKKYSKRTWYRYQKENN